MNTQKDDQRTYTSRQAAQLLGCSLRSLYRWEQDDQVIPLNLRPERIQVGGLSVRIYTAAKVEAIRSRVQSRLLFAAVALTRKSAQRRSHEVE
jgi:hypothetical protein